MSTTSTDSTGSRLDETTDVGGPTTMRGTIDHVVATGPSFLAGDIDADTMANTMVAAVKSYADHQQANPTPVDQAPEDPRLQMVVREIYGCGSGYLAGMCDGACVARTITSLVNEFAPTT